MILHARVGEGNNTQMSIAKRFFNEQIFLKSSETLPKANFQLTHETVGDLN